MSTLIDVSHAIEDGTITYPGLPAPIVCDFLSREASKAQYAEGTSFHIGRIDMVANTGTYVDAPFHRFEDGKDLAELPLDFDCRSARRGGGEQRDGHRSGSVLRRRRSADRAVLVKTGWDEALGETGIPERPPVPDRGGGKLPARVRGCPGWHRFAQHRRHPGRQPPGPHPPAGGRDTHRRAPVQPQRAAGAGLPLSRRAGKSARLRDVSGAGPTPSCQLMARS